MRNAIVIIFSTVSTILYCQSAFNFDGFNIDLLQIPDNKPLILSNKWLNQDKNIYEIKELMVCASENGDFFSISRIYYEKSVECCAEGVSFSDFQFFKKMEKCFFMIK